MEPEILEQEVKESEVLPEVQEVQDIKEVPQDKPFKIKESARVELSIDEITFILNLGQTLAQKLSPEISFMQFSDYIRSKIVQTNQIEFVDQLKSNIVGTNGQPLENNKVTPIIKLNN